MKIEIKTITPQVAERWLKLNYGGNRPLANDRVIEFATSMATGKWTLTHQGICFSDTGKLLDGQHRLSAIIKSGVSVQMLVVTGVSEDTFRAIDIGKVRPAWLAAQLPRARAETWGALVKVFGGALGVGNHPRPDALMALDESLAEHYDKIFEAKAFRRFHATMRAAAVVALITELAELEELRSQVAAFERDDFGSMMPKISQLWKGIVEKRISVTHDRRGLFTKTLSALDFKASAKSTKLMHSEERFNIALASLLTAIGDVRSH